VNVRFAPTAVIRWPYKLDQGSTEVGRDSINEKPRAGRGAQDFSMLRQLQILSLCPQTSPP
jgi:hypothetical protein